jgi:hypothetical protein
VLNHGLFFGGPQPSLLGLRAERLPKTLGSCLNDGINVAAGTSRPAVAVEMVCHQITTQSSAWERIK